jgi:curved DNA-binding protein CbpA
MRRKQSYSFAFALLLASPFAALAAERIPESDDPYEILGVDPLINDDALTDVWKTLAKIHHPDSGGQLQEAQNINEAYQFLKKDRVYYDGGLLPFRGQFKKSETRPVPLSVDEEVRFRRLYQTYLHHEPQAGEITGGEADNNKVLLMYTILHLSGETHFSDFAAFELRAYRELLTHLGIFNLTKSELRGVLMRNPVQALEILLERYDNFNIRLTTLDGLFMAYNYLYLTDMETTEALLNLIERLKNNEWILDRRSETIKWMAIETLKNWLAVYLDAPRRIRREHKPTYKKARNLLFALESFPERMLICAKLLTGREP